MESRRSEGCSYNCTSTFLEVADTTPPNKLVCLAELQWDITYLKRNHPVCNDITPNSTLYGYGTITVGLLQILAFRKMGFRMHYCLFCLLPYPVTPL